MYTIDSDFEGGNVRVCSLGADGAELAVDLRDTAADWFYWAFRVRGAGGRRLHFRFRQGPAVGYFGPAASADGVRWAWAGRPDPDHAGFWYDFAGDAPVYFCHDLHYGTGRFEGLVRELGLTAGRLCLSRRGRPVPWVEMGRQGPALLLTARHHACESPGSWVLEGMLRRLHAAGAAGMRVVAVPFVDMDGVADGDQGKNRRPHDHNRDYAGVPLYPETAAIKELAEELPLRCALDLHAPWHFGGENDGCTIVRKNPIMKPAQVRFAELLQAHTARAPGALRFYTGSDIDEGTGWNLRTDPPATCAGFTAALPGVRLAASLETPYFGTPENRVTQQSLLAYGGCVADALVAFYGEED